MSSTLIWRPCITSHESLPNQLKFVLRKRYDGNINEKVLNMSDINYLAGLEHAGIEGASNLIDAIQKYGEIIISEEY